LNFTVEKIRKFYSIHELKIAKEIRNVSLRSKLTLLVKLK